MEQLSRRCRHCGKVYPIRVQHTCKPSEITKNIKDAKWINSFLGLIAKGLTESQYKAEKSGKPFIQQVNWMPPFQDKKKK